MNDSVVFDGSILKSSALFRTMQITEKVTDEKPDDSRLDELEIQLGNTLPRFYREFLKNTNGGWPEPRKFSFTTKDGTQIAPSLESFIASLK